MKNIALILVIALVSAILFGCQNEHETVKAENPKNESASNGNDQLIEIGEIIKVEVSKTKGVDPAVYEEADVLATFYDLFLSAAEEPGTANVTDPEFYLKLTNEDGSIQRLHLWIDNEQEPSMLMNPNNTHTIYTLSPAMTAQLIELIEK